MRSRGDIALFDDEVHEALCRRARAAHRKRHVHGRGIRRGHRDASSRSPATSTARRPPSGGSTRAPGRRAYRRRRRTGPVVGGDGRSGAVLPARCAQVHRVHAGSRCPAGCATCCPARARGAGLPRARRRCRNCCAPRCGRARWCWATSSRCCKRVPASRRRPGAARPHRACRCSRRARPRAARSASG